MKTTNPKGKKLTNAQARLLIELQAYGGGWWKQSMFKRRGRVWPSFKALARAGLVALGSYDGYGWVKLLPPGVQVLGTIDVSDSRSLCIRAAIWTDGERVVVDAPNSKPDVTPGLVVAMCGTPSQFVGLHYFCRPTFRPGPV